MSRDVTILIVEDEMIIGANISMLLSDLGYETLGIIPSGEKAIAFIETQKPDIILMDIVLKGKLDGIETARIIQETNDIPIIYLTSNTDDHHFNRSKSTRPFAFISKPFKRLDLQRAIELTIAHLSEEKNTQADNEDLPEILDDRIFIKDRGNMKKILIKDITHIEADRNYCIIHTSSSTTSVTVTLILKNLEERLPAKHFLRIHRSYIVNCARIDSITEIHVIIGKHKIPLSRNFRPELLRRLKTI